MSKSTNKITDESNDHKYFIQVPHIVMALCRNPYDFTLWSVIKTVAGDHGTCILNTSDLATLGMMSVGKASDSRAYLLQVGLLEGSFYRDPGYPQPVWHLKIPDIWLKNVEWRQLYDDLKDRVELKAKLKVIFEEANIYRQFNPEGFNLAENLRDVNVKSLHNMKASQYEPSKEPSYCDGGVTQNDGGVTQNETKKNHDRTKKENQGESQLRENRTVHNPESSPPPAIRIYTEMTGITPARALWKRAADSVGEDETNLKRWKETIAGWLGTGWKPGNIIGMLEYYGRGEIPSTGESRRRSNETNKRTNGSVAASHRAGDGGAGLDPAPITPDKWQSFRNT